MENVKGIDFAHLFGGSLAAKKRTNCIFSIWNNANEKMPIIFNHEDNGWIISDNKFMPKLFVGDMTPPSLEDMLLALFEDLKNDDATNHCEQEDF
jgi:hypothetical protein